MLAKDRVSRPSVAGLDRSFPAMCARCMQAPMSRTRSHSRCRGWNQKSERWSAWEKKSRRRVRMGNHICDISANHVPRPAANRRCRQRNEPSFLLLVSSKRSHCVQSSSLTVYSSLCLFVLPAWRNMFRRTSPPASAFFHRAHLLSGTIPPTRTRAQPRIFKEELMPLHVLVSLFPQTSARSLVALPLRAVSSNQH